MRYLISKDECSDGFLRVHVEFIFTMCFTFFSSVVKIKLIFSTLRSNFQIWRTFRIDVSHRVNRRILLDNGADVNAKTREISPSFG